MWMNTMLRSKFYELPFRARFIIGGWILIISLFLLYSIIIVLMHPMFLNHVNNSSSTLDRYNSYVVAMNTSYEGKNSQIAVKTIEYQNLSVEEVINELQLYSIHLIDSDKSEGSTYTLFDTINKVKIIVSKEQNKTIVKFIY